MDGIDRSRPLGMYTDEELAVLPHTFAHKKVGCLKPGPGCPGRCIATCEDLPNLRLTTIRLHAERALLLAVARAAKAATSRYTTNIYRGAGGEPMRLLDLRDGVKDDSDDDTMALIDALAALPPDLLAEKGTT